LEARYSTLSGERRTLATKYVRAVEILSNVYRITVEDSKAHRVSMQAVAMEGLFRFCRVVVKCKEILISTQDVKSYLCLSYSEAINILYTKNVFDFDCLESFVSFSCEVLPQRLDSVRKIQLDFRFNLSVLYAEWTPRTDWARWERTWRIIASMLALEEVRMRFSWPEMSKSADNVLKILEPMQLVTGLKVFEVTMPSLRNVIVKNRDAIPFRIVSKGTQESVISKF
jgi:hypothetical protein